MNGMDKDYTTALLAHELAQAGKVDSLFNLIRNVGAGLVVRNNAQGQTLVATAAEHCQAGVVKGLLKRYGEWIDLDAQDDRGWTALHYAAAFPTTLRKALKMQAKHEQLEKEKRRLDKEVEKPKSMARKKIFLRHESKDAMERSSAAELRNAWNAKSTAGCGGAGLSASGKRVDTRAMLQYFYQESVDDLPMSRSELKHLVKSLEETKLRLIQLLLEAGANPDTTSRAGGLTPFHVAATEAIALRLLETQHLDRSLRSKRGESYLHVASKRGFENAVRELLTRDVPDVRLRTFERPGASACDLAATEAIAKLILVKEEEIRRAERTNLLNGHSVMVPLRGISEPHIVWKTPFLKKRSVSFLVSGSRTLLGVQLKPGTSNTWPDQRLGMDGFLASEAEDLEELHQHMEIGSPAIPRPALGQRSPAAAQAPSPSSPPSSPSPAVPSSPVPSSSSSSSSARSGLRPLNISTSSSVSFSAATKFPTSASPRLRSNTPLSPASHKISGRAASGSSPSPMQSQGRAPPAHRRTVGPVSYTSIASFASFLSDESSHPSSPTSNESTERIDELKRLMLVVLDDIISWVEVVEEETAAVRTPEDIAAKREDCVSLMQIKMVLAAFPVGSVLYRPRALPTPPDPTSAESQRILNFWKSTGFVIWEVKTKVTIIKKYLAIALSYNKLLAVGQTLNKLRSYFPADRQSPRSESSSSSSPSSSPLPSPLHSPHPFASPTSTPVSTSPLPIPLPSSSSSTSFPVSSQQVSFLSSSASSTPVSPRRVVYASASTMPHHRTTLSSSSPSSIESGSGSGSGSGLASGGGAADPPRLVKKNSGGLSASAHARKRLPSFSAFYLTPPLGGESGSDSDSADDTAERGGQAYGQRDSTLSNKLTKGAGISKNRADRFKDLLKEMREGDAAALAGGIIAQALSAQSRMSKLWFGTARPYHSGPMLLFSKSWKKIWCTINDSSFNIYTSVKCDKLHREVSIGEIVFLNHQDKAPKEGQAEYFEIALENESRLCLTAPSPAENTKWILTIDGMKDRSILTTAQKLSFLRSRHFLGVRGGSIKSADDEEWVYNGKTGELSVLDGLLWEGVKIAVSYTWNGQTLVPTRTASDCDSSSPHSSSPGSSSDESETTPRMGRSCFGSGVWDGVTLQWYCQGGGAKMRLQDFSLMEADYTYLWDEQEREFVNNKPQDMHWKFSRHFLASKSNHGHWIVEGDIPEPVVMGLQLMRYTRLGVPAPDS